MHPCKSDAENRRSLRVLSISNCTSYTTDCGRKMNRYKVMLITLYSERCAKQKQPSPDLCVLVNITPGGSNFDILAKSTYIQLSTLYEQRIISHQVILIAPFSAKCSKSNNNTAGRLSFGIAFVPDGSYFTFQSVLLCNSYFYE